MAATSNQGKTFTLFIASLTVAAAGLAFWASGMGKVTLIVGLVGVALAFAGFLKIKPAEGKIMGDPQPAVLQLGGLAVVLIGWVIVLFGLHFTASVSGRMITSLIGLAVSLVGVIGVLPIAANKNAIWKA
jgi:uncharacterized membrane protein